MITSRALGFVSILKWVTVKKLEEVEMKKLFRWDRLKFLFRWDLLLGRPVWVVVKLHKSRNNPGAVFVQNVKDSILAVKMKTCTCNSAFDLLYYSQAKAIGRSEKQKLIFGGIHHDELQLQDRGFRQVWQDL